MTCQNGYDYSVESSDYHDGSLSHDFDLRNIRKDAIGMLKSGASVNKTLKYGMRTRLKYGYNSAMALGEGANPKDIFTGEKLSHKLRNMTTLPTSTKSSAISLFDTISVSLSDDQPQDYDEKCWYAFKVYARPVGDIRTNSPLGLAFADLDEAMQLLRDIKQLKPVKAVDKKYLFTRKNILSWNDFKSYADRVFDKEKPLELSDSAPSSAGIHRQFRTPLKQPSARGAQLTQRGLSAPLTTLEPLPSTVNLKGEFVHVDNIKDALTDVFRDEKARLRAFTSDTGSQGGAASIASSEQSLQSMVMVGKDGMIFSDSSTRAGAGRLTRTNSSIVRGKAKLSQQSLYGETEGNKIRQLLNPKEEYYHKWQRMKQRRSEREAREAQRAARIDTLHSFRRFVANSESSEYDRVSNEKYMYDMAMTQARYDETKRMKREAEFNTRTAAELRHQRQVEEGRYMKDTLRDSAAAVQALREEELEEYYNEVHGKSSSFATHSSCTHGDGNGIGHRQMGVGVGVGAGKDDASGITLSTRGGGGGGCGGGGEESLSGTASRSSGSYRGIGFGGGGSGTNSAELDLASSSVVSIPNELISKKEQAKSLRAFEDAKQEIRSYYENTMSSRIAAYANSRDVRMKKANDIENRITITPIRGSEIFSDEISLTNSEAAAAMAYTPSLRDSKQRRQRQQLSRSGTGSASTPQLGSPSTNRSYQTFSRTSSGKASPLKPSDLAEMGFMQASHDKQQQQVGGGEAEDPRNIPRTGSAGAEFALQEYYRRREEQEQLGSRGRSRGGDSRGGSRGGSRRLSPIRQPLGSRSKKLGEGENGESADGAIKAGQSSPLERTYSTAGESANCGRGSEGPVGEGGVGRANSPGSPTSRSISRTGSMGSRELNPLRTSFDMPVPVFMKGTGVSGGLASPTSCYKRKDWIDEYNKHQPGGFSSWLGTQHLT